MLAEERFSLILDLLARQRTATVQELCEALNASESTIRRDLNELNKVHSGAILTNRCPNPKYRQYTLIKETEV